MATQKSSGLENVGGLAFHIIASKLGPFEAASLSCVNKRFNDWASDDSLWSVFCSHELHLSSPIDPLGNSCSSFKAAYGAWREAFAMYPWPLVRRVKNVWDRIKIWLRDNYPKALRTLRKGASEVKLNTLEKSLRVRLPLPTRLLYRFCDGQEHVNNVLESTMSGDLYGLMGGYYHDNYLVNVYLLPLRDIIEETRVVTRANMYAPRIKHIVMASSCTYSSKMFLLDCEVGQLYVGTKTFSSTREMMPCVPSGLITSVHDLRNGPQQDAMLLWLEEHVRRLENGIIKLRKERNVRGISLFPEQPPICSLATTCGVQVHASAVFVPEFSDLLEEEDKYMFAYSIRMSLKPEGCFVHGMCFDSCQLYWRHWIIKSNGYVVGDINGEGVIGLHPLLHPGKKECVYVSCITVAASPGSMEGSFTFISGSLVDPKGSPFEVEVARFPLVLPDYIF
ncbi:hypothetical protein QVD17_37302 [Tagetes erecta]|uniref:ApaG domain-containing protein n=1 Tax=Tagetes erecta TaxID=13708 RepID=A0AAD8NJX7_TARER|nr:hypothetical protein QVD17_37302 [Tagetes erecta]